MSLTVEQIEQNKQTVEMLIRGLQRENVRTEDLLKKLEESDFYFAPTTTRFYGSYDGGLVEHCLKVLNNMRILYNAHPELHDKISEDSLIIVSLFHDFYKMNFYEQEFKNKKEYSEYGSKKDAGGRYEWVTVSGYKVREVENRFVFGSNSETSEFMIRQYIPLLIGESRAILNAMKNFDESPEVFAILDQSPLTALLHSADVMACYINE